jgi:hypothetical protein
MPALRRLRVLVNLALSASWVKASSVFFSSLSVVFSPRLQRPVTGNLMMLDGLGCCEQTSVKERARP